MVKKIFALTLLSFAFFAAGAQNKITGKIVDAQTQSPEPGAVVQLFAGSAENENMKGYALSDSLGAFSIAYKTIQDGDYVVQVLNMGRRTAQLSFRPTGPLTDIGVIGLEDDVQAINSSKVTAAKPLIKMEADKIAYDVASDADSKATTVLEMLRKVPMVTVDGQDNITVNGSSSFKVYVDGKPNQMLSSNPSKIFKVMPASAVQGIEVITNPGAKYDAEGTGGVLNLITAKAEGGASSAIPDGANGSINVGVDSRGGYDGGLYLNAKKGKFTIGGNLYAGMQVQKGGEQNIIQHVDGGIDIINGGKVQKQQTPYAFGDLTASYDLDSLNLISASLGIQSWAYKQDATQTFGAEMNGTSLYSYDGTSYADGGSTGLDASIDWQHSFAGNKEKMFTVSYRFSGDPEKQFSETTYDNIVGTSVQDRQVEGKDVSQEHTFQADYTTPIGKGQTLSSGVKYIFRNNYSDYDYYLDSGSGYQLQNVSDAHYRNHNNIAAAYSEYAGSFGMFSMKAGLRYEYTWVDMEYADGTSYNSHYDNLVPNLSLQYNLGQTSNLGLTYNMRIRRPGIGYLNPFVNRTSTTQISYGNPDIDPEKSHNIALKYNFFSPKIMLSTGISYRYGEGGIESYQKYAPDPDDAGTTILHSTYGNIVDQNAIGVNYFVNWNPLKDTRIYSSGEIGYRTVKSDVLNQSNEGLVGHFMLGAQQTIFWDMRLSANLFTNSKRYSLQGWSSGFSGVSLGLTKSLLEDKLNITLQGFTNLTGGKMARFKGYNEGKGFSMDSEFAVPIRNIGINLTYNFGKNNFQVKKAKRTISNDDVVNSQNAVQQQNAQTQMQQ